MENQNRLSDAAAHALLDRLFPLGVAGPDVLAELAPGGWDQSPLLACFHPSADQTREDSRRFHHHLETLRALVSSQTETERPQIPQPAELTAEAIVSEHSHSPTPVRPTEELTELVGMCLWDVFSDNHDVVTADGRVADIGSFRGASAFLDEHLSGPTERSNEGDHLRFYRGTAWISQRADLEPVYAMIFRRLRACGADWVYHFPELYLVDFGGPREREERHGVYSPTEALEAERAAAAREADVSHLRADLDEANARAREDAMDRRPPAIVIAYRSVFGRSPRGWPPST